MSDLIEYMLDDRWHALQCIAGDRRAGVFRSTTDTAVQQRALAEEDAALARITELERETLAREADGKWQAEWDDLVAAAFGGEVIDE